MALTLVDTGSSSLNSNTSHSFGINPSGTNRLLVVFAVKGDLDVSANSITFNGQSLTSSAVADNATTPAAASAVGGMIFYN